jgi:hypothetical protein
MHPLRGLRNRSLEDCSDVMPCGIVLVFKARLRSGRPFHVGGAAAVDAGGTAAELK